MNGRLQEEGVKPKLTSATSSRFSPDQQTKKATIEMMSKIVSM